MKKRTTNNQKPKPTVLSVIMKVFAILLILFAVLLVIDRIGKGLIFGDLFLPAKKPPAVSTDEPSPTPEPTPVPTPTPEPTPEPTPTPTPEPWNTITVPNSDISTGFQILVNYKYKFEHTDEIAPVSIAENKNKYLFIGEDRLIDKTVLDALNGFAEAFHKESGDYLFVTSAYRDLAYQEGVYQDYIDEHGEEAAAMYVAKPGYSEHHTGLAVDLSTINAGGERKPISLHEYGPWINEHCIDYGFILRYPLEKVEITHVAYEPWHYRYVGKGNARAADALGFTYEEYVEHLLQYSFETEMLCVSETGEMDALNFKSLPDTGWAIYYVPASDTDSTDIKLPLNYKQYSISGNNCKGFIVTVQLG